jgi:hypothetical protein
MHAYLHEEMIAMVFPPHNMPACSVFVHTHSVSLHMVCLADTFVSPVLRKYEDVLAHSMCVCVCVCVCVCMVPCAGSCKLIHTLA